MHVLRNDYEIEIRSRSSTGTLKDLSVPWPWGWAVIDVKQGLGGSFVAELTDCRFKDIVQSKLKDHCSEAIVLSWLDVIWPLDSGMISDSSFQDKEELKEELAVIVKEMLSSVPSSFLSCFVVSKHPGEASAAEIELELWLRYYKLPVLPILAGQHYVLIEILETTMSFCSLTSNTFHRQLWQAVKHSQVALMRINYLHKILYCQWHSSTCHWLLLAV